MKRTLVKAAALGGALVLAACGDSATTSNCPAAEVTAVTGTSKVQMVVNSMILPTSKYEYSADLDGDGKVDNALANIISVLTSSKLDSQSSVTASIDNGQVVLLLDAESSDANLQAACGSGVNVYTGKELTGGAKPDFTGAGTFATDPAFAATDFLGNIAGGTFSSNAPATTAHPVSFKLKLALVSGAAPVVLPTNGAHITFTSTGGKIDKTCTVAGKAGLPCGSLQGSVKITDLRTQVLPPIAMSLTMQLMADPMKATSQLETLFDTGGCMDDNGMAATKGDFTITTCELANATIIKNLLAADVQIFDGAGNYKPVANGDARDSLSIGVGITAVPAKITVN